MDLSMSETAPIPILDARQPAAAGKSWREHESAGPADSTRGMRLLQ